MDVKKDKHDIEVSVVMPCLNEQATIGSCIEKAQHTIKTMGIRGEVVIGDNGSTDGSINIAEGLGARIDSAKQVMLFRDCSCK